MAITTVVQGATSKLKTIKVTRNVIGPGGTPLYKGNSYQVPEEDAYTLRTGEQAEFVTATATEAEPAPAAAPAKK